jgi:hypothetical protein
MSTCCVRSSPNEMARGKSLEAPAQFCLDASRAVFSQTAVPAFATTAWFASFKIPVVTKAPKSAFSAPRGRARSCSDGSERKRTQT